jgi:Cu(I)/Ag(I) efflux system protein CusF
MKLSAFAFAATLLFSVAGLAQTGQTEGVVRKVDRDTGKITLRHGPIEGELEMPAMSMVFQVKDRALLESLETGDKVAATISKEDGVFYIQSAEKK